MTTYDDVLVETNFLGEEALSANRFTFPEDGLIRRWPFFEGDGKVNDVLVSSPADTFNLYNTNGWVRNNENARYGVSTNVIAGSATAQAVYSTSSFSHMYTETLPSSTYCYYMTNKGTVSLWVAAPWSSYISRTMIGGLFYIGGPCILDANGVKPYNNSSSGASIGFYLFNGRLYFYLAASQTVYSWASCPLASLPDGLCNFVGRWDGADIQLFVNGSLVATTTLAAYPSTYPTGFVRGLFNSMRLYAVDQGLPYSGVEATYCDLAFWDRALLPTEITAVYNEVKYNPGLIEIANVYSYSSYPVETYVEALVDTVYSGADTATILALLLVEKGELVSLVGRTLDTDSSYQYHENVIDTSLHTEVCSSLLAQYEALLDAFSSVDVSTSSLSFSDILNENSIFSDSAVNAQAVIASEIVKLTASQIVNGKYSHEILQKLTAGGIIYASWICLLTEKATMSDSSSWLVSWAIPLLEKIKLAAPEINSLKAIGAISTAISIAESYSSGLGYTSTEIVELSSDVFDRAKIVQTELLRFLVESSALTGLVASIALIDRPEMSASALANATIQEALDSGITFAVSFGFDGEAYSAYVMNTKNFALSEYENYPFNSFAKVGSEYYAASETGLYLLDGSTDAGEDIQATITLGAMDFTGERKTNVCEAFLALRNDGEIAIKIKTDDNIERWYRMNQESDVLRDRREKFARGVTSRFWTFSLENIDGADFEVHEMTFLPLVMKRRI